MMPRSPEDRGGEKLKRIKSSSSFPGESLRRFGFNAYAERFNGRLAMVGILIALGFELVTGQGILACLRWQ